jgi:hypothetical protein
MNEMGIPISDIAKILNTTSEAVRMRFKRRGVKPFRYIGTTGLYHESDIELIRESTRGRPRPKAAPEVPPESRQSATKPKTTKPKKS